MSAFWKREPHKTHSSKSWYFWNRDMCLYFGIHAIRVRIGREGGESKPITENQKNRVLDTEMAILSKLTKWCFARTLNQSVHNVNMSRLGGSSIIAIPNHLGPVISSVKNAWSTVSTPVSSSTSNTAAQSAELLSRPLKQFCNP